MTSILRQLAKYQPPAPTQLAPVEVVEVQSSTHPYADIVERLCTLPPGGKRSEEIFRSLKALNDFSPPPLVGKLYPLELAVLYHLFYHHKITLSDEGVADAILNNFVTRAIGQDGIEEYMSQLKNGFDDCSIKIFLFRVMVAAFGRRDRYTNNQDKIERSFGIKAAHALGAAAAAKDAWKGLEYNQSIASVEQRIIGRIAYVAFWQWCQARPNWQCGDYLTNHSIKLLE